MLRRLGSLSAAILCSWTAVRAAAADDYPYTAFVNVRQAEVRSGPARKHYATQSLGSGFAVEVYRHDADGWCAVRPPEGSVSLAPTRSLRLTGDGAAEAAEANVAVRVCGAKDEACDAVQVLLDLGEKVRVLEPPRPSDRWTKIAPPAGEFRWIAAADLSRSPPVEGVGRTNVAESSDPFAHLRRQSALPQPRPNVSSTVSDGNWRPPGGGDPASLAGEPLRRNEQIRVIEGSPAAIQLAEHAEPIAGGELLAPPLATAAPQTSATESKSPTAADFESNPTSVWPLGIAPGPKDPRMPPRVRFHESAKRSTGPLDPRVVEMHLRLSKTVAATTGGWQFGSLKSEAAAILSSEPTPEVRDQLRDLLDRIAVFETVEERRLRAAGGGGGQLATYPTTPESLSETAAGFTGDTAEVLARARQDLGATPRGGYAGASGPGASGDEPLYDAVGTLRTARSRRSGSPRFALVGDEGEVTALVSPSRGVDLQRFVGQRVGVNGSRDFLPELRQAHVTASRVIPLESPLRR
jgi:hypothetical protein